MSRGLYTILVCADETLEDAFDQPSRWIDHLSNVSADESGMLLDYLSSEFKIVMPVANSGSAPIGYRLVAELSRHDANCLRTRLKKKVHDLSLKDILYAYGHSCEGDAEWLHYFCRQSHHCQTDDCSLVLLVTTAPDISEERKTWWCYSANKAL